MKQAFGKTAVYYAFSDAAMFICQTNSGYSIRVLHNKEILEDEGFDTEEDARKWGLHVLGILRTNSQGKLS
jgi:hypothetical protein